MISTRQMILNFLFMVITLGRYLGAGVGIDAGIYRERTTQILEYMAIAMTIASIWVELVEVIKKISARTAVIVVCVFGAVFCALAGCLAIASGMRGDAGMLVGMLIAYFFLTLENVGRSRREPASSPFV